MMSRFVKDPRTESVVNTDIDAIRAAKRVKEKRLQEKARQEQLEKEVSDIKDDINEIKNLLRQVANGNNIT